MKSAISHAYRELESYEKHRETIVGKIREAISESEHETFGSDARDKTLSTIESYLNALDSEDQGG